MKRTIFIALAVAAQMTYANVVTGVAAVPEGYYNAVDAKGSPESILDALCGIIDGHTVISYSGLEPYYEQTDFYNDTLWDMYSTCTFYMSHANVPQKAVCDGWNKEHVCCQSWLGSGPMVSDLFNVYPTDARINNLRSNYPYGVVGSGFNGFSKDPEHHGLGKLGSSTTSGVGTVYEPDDRYKGDFARTFFYMVARYRNNSLNAGHGATMFVSSPTNFTAYSLSFLLEWHRNDPVSQKEIDRNQAVYGIQHNRNPFIDYPELAEYIWGNKMGQTVNMAAMTPTCEGGGYDPGQATKYGVTWYANGTVLRTDSVIAGRAVLDAPEAPETCDPESELFMGWTTAPIESTVDQLDVLYKTANAIPVVTADMALHAVYAHGTEGVAVTPETFVFDEQNQEGWTTDATFTTYWLLDQGKTLVSPEVNLAGLNSIVVNMRTYGGNTYNTLDVYAGETEIAHIVATNGKTLADATWTNTQSFSGSSPLTFRTNYGTSQGIGVKSVTINATGAGMTYSRYMTTCELSAISYQHSEVGYQKVLIDGQLYILINEQKYNIQGQRVQ